jgi:hypothetical protein
MVMSRDLVYYLDDATDPLGGGPGRDLLRVHVTNGYAAVGWIIDTDVWSGCSAQRPGTLLVGPISRNRL